MPFVCHNEADGLFLTGDQRRTKRRTKRLDEARVYSRRHDAAARTPHNWIRGQGVVPDPAWKVVEVFLTITPWAPAK